MSDLITVLRSSTQRMCKVWLADGTIQQYDLAKWFDISQRDVADIHGLSALLTSLETDPHSCIIRGTPNSATDTTRSVRRLIDHFEDKALHAVLVEIDNYSPVMNDPKCMYMEVLTE
jgi:putative DNA primase/helicase